MMYRDAAAKIGGAAGVFRPIALTATVVACLSGVGSAGAQELYGNDAITPEQPEQVAAADYAAETLRVNIWLDRGPDEVYRRGDAMEVRFETNADAYAVVYRIDTEGLVTLLWPRSHLDDGFVFGSHEYRLPVSGGGPLPVSGVEGVGYVQAIVSRYPFDLRELALDFHHETAAEPQEFYVAGDPYLAMNEVNFAVTGLEDASGYAVTNHVAYYVHQQVDHPRYLCNQCHTDDGFVVDPYRDVCLVDIHHDYGWHNDWYATYGYYPVYYQPVYVYVDPWSYRPWVNYWYYPWYAWPTAGVNIWFGGYYDWCYSPYYGGDVYSYAGGSRYVPLSKDGASRTKVADRDRAGGGAAKGQRPGGEVITAMKTRQPLEVGADSPRGGSYRDVDPAVRPRTEFERTTRQRPRPGLQIGGRDLADSPRGDVPGGGKQAIRIRGGQRPAGQSRADRYGKPAQGRDGHSGDMQRNRNTGATDRRHIKPVRPRTNTNRVWSGRRQVPSNDRSGSRQVSPGSGSGSGSRSTVGSRDQGSRTSGNAARGSTVKPSAPRGSRPVNPSRPPAKRSGGGGSPRSGASRGGGSTGRSAPVRR